LLKHLGSTNAGAKILPCAQPTGYRNKTFENQLVKITDVVAATGQRRRLRIRINWLFQDFGLRNQVVSSI